MGTVAQRLWLTQSRKQLEKQRQKVKLEIGTFRHPSRSARRRTCLRSLMLFVAHMHGKGIAHLDIKPENIMFDSEGANGVLKGAQRLRYGALRIARDGQRRVRQKADIWSAGVVMYILLCGRAPFLKGNDVDTLNLIKSGPRVQSAKDCIKALLEQPNPRHRPSAVAVLNMPWLKQQAPETIIVPDTLRHLRAFANQSRIRRLLLGLMADQLVGSGANQLLGQFYTLDKDFSGTLECRSWSRPPRRGVEVSELVKAAKEAIPDLSEHEINRMFEALDVDRTGTVDIKERGAGFVTKEAFMEVLLERAQAGTLAHAGAQGRADGPPRRALAWTAAWTSSHVPVTHGRNLGPQLPAVPSIAENMENAGADAAHAHAQPQRAGRGGARHLWHHARRRPHAPLVGRPHGRPPPPPLLQQRRPQLHGALGAGGPSATSAQGGQRRHSSSSRDPRRPQQRLRHAPLPGGIASATSQGGAKRRSHTGSGPLRLVGGGGGGALSHGGGRLQEGEEGEEDEDDGGRGGGSGLPAAVLSGMAGVDRAAIDLEQPLDMETRDLLQLLAPASARPGSRPCGTTPAAAAPPAPAAPATAAAAATRRPGLAAAAAQRRQLHHEDGRIAASARAALAAAEVAAAAGPVMEAELSDYYRAEPHAGGGAAAVRQRRRRRRVHRGIMSGPSAQGLLAGIGGSGAVGYGASPAQSPRSSLQKVLLPAAAPPARCRGRWTPRRRWRRRRRP
ncbi:hypothetical protein HXX76_014811, partial [Chlamydomonas incerta]